VANNNAVAVAVAVAACSNNLHAIQQHLLPATPPISTPPPRLFLETGKSKSCLQLQTTVRIWISGNFAVRIDTSFSILPPPQSKSRREGGWERGVSMGATFL